MKKLLLVLVLLLSGCTTKTCEIKTKYGTSTLEQVITIKEVHNQVYIKYIDRLGNTIEDYAEADYIKEWTCTRNKTR